MDIFRYIVRFLYRIRWYLAILPMISLVVAWFMTRNMERQYDTNTTIYTGMITGYNIEGGTGTAGGNSQVNINNLMLIITTDNTIHEVSLRLFARCMMYGNERKDNNYISAEHFRALNASVPAEVKALIIVIARTLHIPASRRTRNLPATISFSVSPTIIHISDSIALPPG